MDSHIWLCKSRTYLNLQMFSIQRCSFSFHSFHAPFWESREIRNIYLLFFCFIPAVDWRRRLRCTTSVSVWNFHLFWIYPLNILLLLNLQCNSFSFFVQSTIEKQITRHTIWSLQLCFGIRMRSEFVFFIHLFIFLMFFFFLSSVFILFKLNSNEKQIDEARKKKKKAKTNARCETEIKNRQQADLG